MKENGPFIIHMNSEAQILWSLYDEVDKLAEDFVSNQMNLDRNTFLFHYFLTLWKECGFPEAMENNDNNDAEMTEFNIRQNRKIWAERKIIKENSKFRIVDSVHWYNGSVDPASVGKLLLNTKWPKVVEAMVTKAKGGRPRSESSLIYKQAVICAILKSRRSSATRKLLLNSDGRHSKIRMVIGIFVILLPKE